ncbi:MAG: TVP38/TMEM64 family protein [Candidatus Binatia bacterium]
MGPFQKSPGGGAPSGAAGSWRSTRRSVAILASVVLALLIGRVVRDALGVDLSVRSIRLWVGNFGWAGPLIYMALMTFRHVFLLPSTVILLAGGLCFGSLLGTAFGAAGIVAAGMLEFAFVRSVRPPWLLHRLSRRTPQRPRVGAAGLPLITLVTAHPLGPMSPFHWAAGLSAIPAAAFAIALSLGALMRAFALTFFGAVLLQPGTPRFYAATALLAAITLIPLAHPGVRHRLFRSQGRNASD